MPITTKEITMEENVITKLRKSYFYYRYCATTNTETFIFREKPISDNLQEMYSSYANDVEFPLGTLFSIIHLFEESIRCNNSRVAVLKEIDYVLDEIKEAEDIKEALRLFLWYAESETEYSRIGSDENISLFNLEKYLEECIENYSYATSEYLDKVILQNNIPFPKADKIVVDYYFNAKKREYYNGDMKLFLDNKAVEQIIWSKFNSLTGGDAQVYKYDYYSVSSLSELVVVMLKVIFDKRKVIQFCHHCYNYFVPLKRNDEKYCSTNVVFGRRDCKKDAKAERQRQRLAMRQSRIDKMERSARSMLYQRRYENLKNISDDEYIKMCDSITDFRKDVMQEKRTVDEYEEFLKTFFTRKYK